MNHKTRAIAKILYDEWKDDVSCYAPPGSKIATFDEQRSHFIRKAVAIKKRRDFVDSEYKPDSHSP